MLRGKSNDELLRLYDNDLVLRLHSPRNLSDTRKLLARFKQYLGDYPPSSEMAKSFLAQYADRKPRTLYRYAQMLRIFMKWYGEPIDDLQVKIPKSLPPYTEDSQIEKLLHAIENKKTHKGNIVRDVLLVEVALKTGMRRGELSKLEVRHIHEDFLEVREGKNKKDRVIPLSPPIAPRLKCYVKDKKPTDKVFGLAAPSITMKIKAFARSAGIEDLHAHALRHKFATDLLEHGADIRSVQYLLGHENLSTTQVYLSLTDKRLRETINLLDEPAESKRQDQEETYRPTDGEMLIAATNNTTNETLDRETFRNSDSILNERELRNFLLGLEQHHSYRLSEYLKVARFWEFTGLGGNKYTDPESRQLLDNLWGVLDKLVPFLKEEFEEDKKVKKLDELECRLDPSGLRYLHNDSDKAERIAQAESQLDDLINTARESYKDYRAGIRSRLHV